MSLTLHHRPLTRLLLLIISILVLLTIMGSYGFYAIQQDLLEESGESLAFAATTIAEQIDQLLTERIEDLKVMTQSSELSTQGPCDNIEAMYDFKTTHPTFRSLTIATPTLDICASSIQRPLNTHQWHNLQGPSAIQRGLPYHIEITPSLDETKKDFSILITLALPTNANSLIAEIPLSLLNDIFNQTQQAIQKTRQTQSPVEWQLLTKEGLIILDSILHEEQTVSLTTLDLPSAKLVASGKSGFIQEMHKRRYVPVITGFSQTAGPQGLQAPRWGILLRIDQSDILPAIHGKIFRLGIGIIIVLLPFLGIIFWSARQVESEHQQVVKAEAKYRDIFENSPEGIFQSTPEGQFLNVNPAMAKILGYDTPETLLQSMTDLTQQFYRHPIQRQDLLRKLQAKGTLENFEFQFYRQDGSIRWASGNIRAIQNDSGTIQYLEGTLKDITYQKESAKRLYQLQEQLLLEQEQRTQQISAELDKAKAALVTQAKLATLGQLSGSIAHELRNPLGAMRNAIFLVKRRTGNADEKTHQYLSMIEEEIHNSDLIIQGLLEVARGKEPIKQRISFKSLINKIIDEQSFPDAVTFQIETEEDPFDIWVDPQQFSQVLNNIFVNACQAMENQGQICIKAQSGSEMTMIKISDTGPGILEEQHEELFEPLFTTKTKGTGLGLTICREIIQRHGGTIVSTHKQTIGAIFEIHIPKYPLNA